jgi:hypothetical protein
VEARKAGKLRYIGFTGHKDPRIHLYMLEVTAEQGFTFDTVQMPLNVMDAHYRSFEKLVLPELASVVITGCESMDNLEQALEVARTFRPMGQAEVQVNDTDLRRHRQQSGLAWRGARAGATGDARITWRGDACHSALRMRHTDAGGPTA